MLNPPMILVLCLWLISLSFTSQQQQVSNCNSSSGDLPAPSLFLDKSLAYVGDTVLLLCLTPTNSHMSFAFLCKDGKEMARKPTVPGKFSFEFPYHVAEQSSSNFSCGYQHKALHNQVRSSHLSIVRYLHVTDKTSNSNSRDAETTSPHGLQIILGIAVPTTLGLCFILFLLTSKAARQCKNRREQYAKESTNNTAAGKLIDTSSAGCSHYTGPQGKDKDTENYESLNTRALEISPYSTLHLQQKHEPAASAPRLDASSIGCFHEMEPANKEVAGEGYEMLNPSSVQNVLYSTFHRKQ